MPVLRHVGSVRASSIPTPTCAKLVHTFCPLTTHSSPSRTASCKRREVRTGTRLAEELAPLLLTSRDPREEALAHFRPTPTAGSSAPRAADQRPAGFSAPRARRGRRGQQRPRHARPRPPSSEGHCGATQPLAPSARTIAGLSTRSSSALTSSRSTASRQPEGSTRSSNAAKSSRPENPMRCSFRRPPEIYVVQTG